MEGEIGIEKQEKKRTETHGGSWGNRGFIAYLESQDGIEFLTS
jgi:hypothetical protein